MEKSETLILLQTKIIKILTLLLLVRLGIYLPIPTLDLNLFAHGQITNPLFGFAKNLVGTSFLGVGSLGILPYINASIIMQLLTPLVPALNRLQKEEGELGRQEINKYTRYITFIWAFALSTIIAIFLIKPIVFDWSFQLGAKIILALTSGAILTMWFAELITEEGLGNGSSMIIFINIVGGIPTGLNDLNKTIFTNSPFPDNVLLITQILTFYCFIVLTIIIFQESYKHIPIISAKQANVNKSLGENIDVKSSYIPLRVNQGGIMPLVFSSTVVVFLVYPAQYLLGTSLADTFSFLPQLITAYSFLLNILLVIFFSCFYAILVLKPEDMSQNLAKMAYTIPGIRQGKETKKYLQTTITRLAFIGGLFLVFLAFLPLLLGNIVQLDLFKNVTSLLIMIGVITDTTSQMRGYLVFKRYEDFKEP
jgi:preprotein translocase subunit SecY